jgi:hypothetical protein
VRDPQSVLFWREILKKVTCMFLVQQSYMYVPTIIMQLLFTVTTMMLQQHTPPSLSSPVADEAEGVTLWPLCLLPFSSLLGHPRR